MRAGKGRISFTPKPVTPERNDTMKLPNNYGCVYKMSGKRRRPYAVRVKIGEHDNGSAIYKYLGYFEKSPDAYTFLAKYNEGLVTPDNRLKSNILFRQVFDEWITEHERYRDVGKQAHASYTLAFAQLKELHNKIFCMLRVDDLQAQIDKLENMSESTIQKPITLLHFMYQYALKKEYVDKDYSQYIIRVSAREKQRMHKAFTHKEIKRLWEDGSEDSKRILIFIYTGFRATELLEIKKENVHLKEGYMIGGKKTDAGKDRAVPIHKKILPLVKEFYNNSTTYLFEENGKPITYMHFKDYHMIPLMEKLSMKHTLHDTRHTCASLLKEFGCDDLYRKLILGHHIKDFTDRVYTHVEIARLNLEVNKINI